MAGYWPIFFLNLQKIERGQSAILTEQAWSVKDLLLLLLLENFSCRTRQVVPSGRDSSMLSARVANHSIHHQSFILPAHGAGHVITRVNGLSILTVMLTFLISFSKDFYFKCAMHPAAEGDSCAALNLIRSNTRNIPCLACTDVK